MADVSCPNCGGTPMGSGCYHICFNSDHYYSPEREYEDAMMDTGYDDLYERYGATARDAELFTMSEMEHDYGDEDLSAYAVEAWPNPISIDPDDIPF